jgi:hypothetical protein
MEDTAMVQEVTTKSWGSRIVSAFWGIIIGFVLIIASGWLIFWNESHGLNTAKSLQQTQQILKTVPNAPLNPTNNLQVVYFTGLATTEDSLKDTMFGLTEKAIKLDRKVEMYQWQEDSETRSEKNLGGSETETKTYTYKQVWSSQLIDSSHFKETGHQNPANMAVKSKTQYADLVTVGDFTLPQELVATMSGDTDIDLAKTDLSALQEKVHKPVKHDGDSIFIGEDSVTPKTGDLKITYSEILPQKVSVIGQQIDHTIQPFVAPAGQSVSLLVMGEKSPQQMIDDAESANAMMMWILRLVSLIMMISGFGLILAPLSVLADVVPFFGSIVSFGTGLVAFVVGLLLWTCLIAMAWFAARPLMAVGIVVGAIAICYFVFSYRKKADPV